MVTFLINAVTAVLANTVDCIIVNELRIRELAALGKAPDGSPLEKKETKGRKKQDGNNEKAPPPTAVIKRHVAIVEEKKIVIERDITAEKRSAALSVVRSKIDQEAESEEEKRAARILALKKMMQDEEDEELRREGKLPPKRDDDSKTPTTPSSATPSSTGTGDDDRTDSLTEGELDEIKGSMGSLFSPVPRAGITAAEPVPLPLLPDSAEVKARSAKLKQEFTALQKQAKYQEFQTLRATLPAADMKERILNLIEASPVVVISGATG
jgi:hypothetical protein